MLRLYDTMTRRVSDVQPLEPGVVKMYTCGPTVYRDAHIGNLRSYLMADWIRRVLEAQGLSVLHVKNITDVGHMRQEMLEQGGDKILAAASDAGTTPQEIARFYTERFLADEWKLNIIPADQYPTATEHIDEMIAVVQSLIDQGYAYEAEGNVYFSISNFPEYGALSGNTQDQVLLEAVRIEADHLKRDLRDFTLWKLAEPGRELKWPSPWGEGFPGWHIECSAMSIKYLSTRFDIHTGGVDNVFPHHEGEIAQSQCFTGQPVVSLWVHGQHLLADGVKMAKSASNSFILSSIDDGDIDPLAFRYLCLTSRYSSRLNFTFTSLRAAQRALLRLRNRVWVWEKLPELTEEDDEAILTWESRFMERVNDNLDMPGALALTWKMASSDLPGQTRLKLLRSYDRILGLGLDNVSLSYGVADDILGTVQRRADFRLQAEFERWTEGVKQHEEADALRDEVARSGYVIEDTRNGTRVRPKSRWEKREEAWHPISSSNVASLVDEPDSVDFSVGVVACNYVDDVSRCIQSALRWSGDRSVEVVVLDNGSIDGTSEWLHHTASKDPRLRLIHADHVLGEGAAKNVVLKSSLGRTIVLLDTSVEVVGDIYGPIQDLIDDDTIGVVGPFGLRTNDLHHFHDDEEESGNGDDGEGEGEGEVSNVDAMQAYLFAFRRSRLSEVGMMREIFRFYRNLDLDYSFQFKDKSLRIVSQPTLPVLLHEHRVWSNLNELEREEVSGKNYRRFLDMWGDRSDLLVGSRKEG